MARPKKIVICGYPFQIKWVGVSDDHLTSTEYVGKMHVTEQQIEVGSQNMGFEQERDTVLHEAIHAIIRMLGRDGGSQSFKGGHEGEESFVYSFTTALLVMLRTNPSVTAWLMEKQGHEK
jgi:hypothetical protein